MCRKLACLASFVAVLSLVLTSVANAADPSLVGWWRLDESSGATARDSSGNGSDGTLNGGLQWVDGKIDGALQFDGSSGYVRIPHSDSLKVLNQGDFTCAMWFNQDFVTLANLLQQTDSNGAGRTWFYVGNSGEIQTWLGGAATGSGVIAEAGTWYHAAVVVEELGATDSVQLYVNGEPAGTPGQLGMEDCEGDYLISGTKNLDIRWWNGLIDDVQLYNRAVAPEEIAQIMEGPGGEPIAELPNPVDKATDVPRDVVLEWAAGGYADQHDVYFGTSFDDVNSAGNLDPIGPDQVYRARQDADSYAVDEKLDFGQTYYWRIDEVNAPPDSTIFKGDVWQFTAEPIGYPIENITVTASSVNRTEEGPENTINGSGLDDDDLHSFENTAMWLSSGVDPNATWIQCEFDRVHKLYQMWVWNYNSSVEPLVGFGIRQATIEHSTDGVNWSTLGTNHEFAQGTGAPGYAPNTTVDLSGVMARYVRITANSNWGGMLNQYGLSEVRFLYLPIWAREPSPDSGATDADVNAFLSFRAGREASKHDVYLSTDEQAVIDGTAPVTTVTEPSYASSLDLNSTYYWRVDEANDAETPTAWQGDIWNLSTQEYLAVDDFEAYNEIPAGEEGSNLVYLTWIDGFDNPSVNGSTMGYTAAFQPSMEKSIVHDGIQSAPLFYDNTTAAYSEVTANLADLKVGQDWTRHGIKALTLRFSGDPTNVVQQMYVKINGVKVPYDGSAEDTRLAGWQMWYIDLASIGVNLSNVTELSIGFERIGAVGGQGMVLIDGVRLYSYDRQFITPVDPGAVGLQAQYEFEGNTNDSSGNARHGTAAGNPIFGEGKVGQAIGLDGLGDYINIDGYKGLLGSSAITVTAWIKTSSTDTGAIVGWGPNVSGERFGFRVDLGRLRLEHHGGNVQGDTLVNDGGWHHVAVTVQENVTISYPDVILYLDGMDDTRPTTDPDPFNITAAEDVRIGSRPASNDRLFIGQIDEVRIYDRSLTQEEVTWLAGRTEPFDKPF